MKDKVDFLIDRVLHSLKRKEYNVDEGWDRVRRRSVGKTERRILVRRIGYAAACVVCVLGVVAYLEMMKPEEKNPTMSVMASAPISHDKVELILANGKSIDIQHVDTVNDAELNIQIARDSVTNNFSYSAPVVKDSVREVQYNRLIVPKGSDFYFYLPDGSFVAVNSESILQFPVQFSKDSRIVYLEGEAYFEVKKDSQAPFKVITGGNKEITVLGTTFNVSAYTDDEEWATTLVEGRVAIDDGRDTLVLNPSEQCVINNISGKAKVATVDTDLYTAWRSGRFQVRDCRFEDLVKKLERWYDFTMVYQDDTIKDLRFRGVISKDRPLHEMLRYLEETTNISFEIEGKIITVKKGKIK